MRASAIFSNSAHTRRHSSSGFVSAALSEVNFDGGERVVVCECPGANGGVVLW